MTVNMVNSSSNISIIPAIIGSIIGQSIFSCVTVYATYINAIKDGSGCMGSIMHKVHLISSVIGILLLGLASFAEMTTIKNTISEYTLFFFVLSNLLLNITSLIMYLINKNNS